MGVSTNFDFSNVNSTFENKIVKLTTHIALVQIFTTFLTLVWELLDIDIINNASFKKKSFFS